MLQSNDTRTTSPTSVILAIFDIDGTFIRGDSFKRFCWFAAILNGISFRWLWRFALHAVTNPTSLREAGLLKMFCLRICLPNYDKVLLGNTSKNFVDSALCKRIRSTALDRMRWHKQQNHIVMFLSASPDLYLKDFGLQVGVDRVVCTKFLDRDGQFTGELYGVNCKGTEKRRRLLAEYPADEIAWNQSYGYGNSIEDASFLELLGHPVVINPDAELRKIAVQRNWRIETWH